MFAEVRPTLLIEGGTNRGGSFSFFCCAQRTVNGNQCRPQFNTAEEFWSSRTTIANLLSTNQIAASLPLDQIYCSQTGENELSLPVVNYLHGCHGAFGSAVLRYHKTEVEIFSALRY